jgi:hypothetical protein
MVPDPIKPRMRTDLNEIIVFQLMFLNLSDLNFGVMILVKFVY